MNDELYKVYLDSGKCVRILGRVLDSGTCFGFWEVFLDSGKCFGFWEVFWILGRVLDSGKCFGFWDVFCPYEPPYSSSRRIKLEFKKLHMLLTYRKFNQLIYFFSQKM